MLDADISTAGALHHLSAPDLTFADAHALDRRRFLQLVGMGLGAGMVAGPGSSLLESVLSGSDTSWAAGPIGPDDGIVVVIGMLGGNDGLNTVVPITDGLYYDQHGSLAIAPGQTLPLDATTGLNPALTSLKEFWDQGNLAIVEGVGYPDPDLSHFNSMAKWMSGKPTGLPTSGWIGRWLDGYLNGSKDLFAAAEIGYSLPLHQIGEATRATTIPAARPSFGADPSSEAQRQYQTIRNMYNATVGHWEQQIALAFRDQLDVAATIAPQIPEALPDAELTARLEVAARLINANLGFRVLTASFGDFDSHAGQPDMHPVRMEELNAAVRRFFEVLHPTWSSRVTVITFSEFGRTSHGNDGAGTDHGTAAPHFVFGDNVKGGFYGQRPSLAGLRRWGRMDHHVDFRDYFGSVIDGWLGGGGSDVFGRSIQNLELFADAPGSGGSFPPLDQPGDFVPIAPVRMIDTRDGTGAPVGKIGPGGSIVVQSAGVAGLTGDIRALVVNVTATQTEADTYMTVYPRGISRPLAANLNPTPLRATGNLVLTGVSDNGEFVIYNHNGSTHCVVDVVGFYSATSAARLTPLVPARLLDTRDGTGVPAGRVSGGQTIDVTVAGRGGVSANAQAVILNVTTVTPTTGGYVTVWAEGEPQPHVASVNYLPGYTIPNLVMCKVGASGKISLFASGGTIDLVADVVGCFTDAGSRHVPVPPARLLDTREGNGAPLARLGPGQEISVRVAGLGGVPANASAAVLNVTAVAATAHGYITVYPDGVARPGTANLNVGPGDTVPNLVVSKIGTDGRVRIFNANGSVDVVADVNGYFV